MKYQANPVIVDAFRIISVGDLDYSGAVLVRLENGDDRRASASMTARYVPGIGDYWVIQSDGYEYVNPKDVFERKYSPCTPDPRQPPVFKRATCKGCYALGSACGHCERCDWETSLSVKRDGGNEKA